MHRRNRQKREQSEKLAQDVQAFLARGGVIEQHGTYPCVTFGVNNRAFGKTGHGRYKREGA